MGSAERALHVEVPQSGISIVNEVRDLGLPTQEYVVAGSGGLEAREVPAALGKLASSGDVYTAHDIDIGCTHGLYVGLKREPGWIEQHYSDTGDHYLTQAQTPGRVELSDVWHFPNSSVPTQDIIESAETVSGVPFVNVDLLLRSKQIGDRPKDIEHSRLLVDFLDKPKIFVMPKKLFVPERALVMDALSMPRTRIPNPQFVGTKQFSMG